MRFTWKRSPESRDSKRPQGRYWRRWHTVRRVVPLLHQGHQRLEIARLVLAGHQQGVGGVDDDQIVHAQDGDQARVGVDQGAARVGEDDVALDHVAGFIGGRDLGEGRPAADVRPTAIQRDDYRSERTRAGRPAIGRARVVVWPGQPFEHRVVDRLRRTGPEGLLVQADEV